MKIAIGPIFTEHGGVSEHIRSIHKYSIHKPKIVPNKITRRYIGKSIKKQNIYMNNSFKTYMKLFQVMHSHAHPNFTRNCQKISKKVNWVHTYHTMYFDEDYTNGCEPWQNKINKTLTNVASKADIKISVSKWFQEYLLNAHSIDSIHIPNGVDVDICNNASSERFIKKYQQNNFILYIGYLKSEKNPKSFIDLAKHIPDKKFIMIGDGFERKTLETKLNIRLPDNLISFPPMIHSDVLDALAACDVYVMTSKREGLPTTLLEAMAMAKPVVAPAHYGCKEVIQDETYGFLYEPDSVEDLVEKTYRALESKNQGQRAKVRVQEQYDWKVIIKEIDSAYNQLLNL